MADVKDIPEISGDIPVIDPIETEIEEGKRRGGRPKGSKNKKKKGGSNQSTPKDKATLDPKIKAKIKDTGFKGQLSAFFDNLAIPDPKDAAELAGKIHDKGNPMIAALAYKAILPHENIGVLTYINPEQAQSLAMGILVFQNSGSGKLQEILDRYIMPMYLVGAAAWTAGNIFKNMAQLKATASNQPEELKAWLDAQSGQRPGWTQEIVTTEPKEDLTSEETDDIVDIDAWIRKAQEEQVNQQMSESEGE